ncbi:MAG: hypothetical protein ABF248_05425 [Yoonia sp.]
MHVLIVQSNLSLGQIWARHLERMGAMVTHVRTGAAALDVIASSPLNVIVLDLVLAEGSALTVADSAQFNHPAANVVFVTDTTFFSDGSIFEHCANARAFMETTTPPDDLAAIVHYYALDANRAHVVQSNPRQGSSG